MMRGVERSPSFRKKDETAHFRLRNARRMPSSSRARAAVGQTVIRQRKAPTSNDAGAFS